MNTDRWIQALAQGAGPAPLAQARRRLPLALAGGALGAWGLSLAWQGPAPGALFGTAAFWLKLALAGLVAAGALAWLGRLGRPGASQGWGPALLGGTLLAAGGVGLAGWFDLPSGLRASTVWNLGAWACPRSVLSLALPAFAAVAWGLRSLAPTRLRRAGFAAGLAAGAAGAFGYAFSCAEQAPAFIMLWYGASILAAGGLGALLGPRLLRW